MPWTDDFIGVPFARRGRAESLAQARTSGVDCWGLCMLASLRGDRARKSQTAGWISGNTIRETILKARQMMESPSWNFTEWGQGDPQEMDIVLMQTFVPMAGGRLQPLHVGVYDGAGRILHVQPSIERGAAPRPSLGATLICCADKSVRQRILGFGRWHGLNNEAA